MARKKSKNRSGTRKGTTRLRVRAKRKSRAAKGLSAPSASDVPPAPFPSSSASAGQPLGGTAFRARPQPAPAPEYPGWHSLGGTAFRQRSDALQHPPAHGHEAPPAAPEAPGAEPARVHARAPLPTELPYHAGHLAGPIRADFPESDAPPPRIVHASKPQVAPPLADAADLTQAQIYEMLAALLVPYARRMESEMHPKIGFCLKAKSAQSGRESHFGAVQIQDDGVDYHLFPLYGHPELLEKLNPDLFNRMCSKTCFHLTQVNAAIVADLAELTRHCFERFLADGMA
jgi:hypothetical protein